LKDKKCIKCSTNVYVHKCDTDGKTTKCFENSYMKNSICIKCTDLNAYSCTYNLQ